eukprot:GILK01014239.1.p1 GENE.GILK01014239.1~~GILK01014239.1.p1  ORF type:complete len:913 (+),score=147.65 GILK01014239.1:42-2741(+)
MEEGALCLGLTCWSCPSAAINESIARFRLVKKLYNNHLCELVDIVQGRHGHLSMISEHYTSNLEKELFERRRRRSDPVSSVGIFSQREVKSMAYQLLTALHALNMANLVHGNLHPRHVLFDNTGTVRLTQWSLHHVTSGGSDADITHGYAPYLAPELIALGPHKSIPSCKSDIWAIGMILLSLLIPSAPWLLESQLNSQIEAESLVELAQLAKTSSLRTLLDEYIRYHNSSPLSSSSSNSSASSHFLPINSVTSVAPISSTNRSGGSLNSQSTPIQNWLAQADFSRLHKDMKEFLSLCLTIDPEERLDAESILSCALFQESLDDIQQSIRPRYEWRIRPVLRCLLPNTESETVIESWPIDEVFYFWGLVGGSIESELKHVGLISVTPSIFKIPPIMFNGPNGKRHPIEPVTPRIYAPNCTVISLDRLRVALEEIYRSSSSAFSVSSFSSVSSDGPIGRREKDFRYQLHRVNRFKKLLKRYPMTRAEIFREAQTDIPPILRAQVWSAILAVQGDPRIAYELIDLHAESPWEHQISLDIPRCHQYNQLIGSSEGRAKLGRILKAWTLKNPDLCYVQGLDSVCTPLLYLNFDNEANAFCCLQSVTTSYIRDFFLPDNSRHTSRHLILFKQLLTFVDPELACHLMDIQFSPDMYAVSWFLTLFSYIFPLDKIVLLWDRILVNPPSYPLFVGVSVMIQLRTTLMTLDANTCLAFLHTLPGSVDVENCIRVSFDLFQTVPMSVTLMDAARKTDTYSEGEAEIDRWWETDKTLNREDKYEDEICARISLDDLLAIRETCIVIDIRKPEDFEKYHFAESHNFPSEHGFTDILSGLLDDRPPNTIIVVIGKRDAAVIKFAANLIYRHFTRVCVLNGGVDAIRADSPSYLLRGKRLLMDPHLYNKMNLI